MNDGIGMGAALWGRVCQQTTYRNRESTSYKQFQEAAPEIAPEEYDSLQEICAKHTVSIRKALSRETEL